MTRLGSHPAVMAGLDPAIHVVRHAPAPVGRAGVDARNKSGHDGLGNAEGEE